MNEYKIIENTPNAKATEGILNGYAVEGWRVVSFGEFQICLEREKVVVEQEEQHLLQG